VRQGRQRGSVQQAQGSAPASVSQRDQQQLRGMVTIFDLLKKG
jgi:hypothetical protein